MSMRVTIMGCGSSGGVPRVGGDWGACDPANPKNRRMRCGLLIEKFSEVVGQGTATTILIDTPPDLREQVLRAEVKRLDAIVYTHDHADQTHGIDDVRPFFHRRGAPIPTYMDAATATALRARFGYVFAGAREYPAIMSVERLLEPREPFHITGPGGGVALTPLLQDHGSVMSLGFRCGDWAYSNDVVRMPEETLAALTGLDVWIVDALRDTPHPTHASVSQALAWAERLSPARTILTNLHVDLDYEALRRRLPENVEPAFDGLSFSTLR
jgi:phosphoribosyl 1,2-cyclic phosphate phosphodiesterase